MVLGGGHHHRERNVFEHVHYLFWPREGDVDGEVKRLPCLVEDVGHRHGEDEGSSLDWSDHALGLIDQIQKLEDVFQGFQGDLIRIDLSELGKGHRGGECPDLILAQRGHFLDLGEGAGLVDVVEVHPCFGAPSNVLGVVDQDLMVLDGGGE